MATQLQVKTFDYSDLDKEAKSKLIWCAGDINKKKTAHLKTGIEIGESIAIAHAVLVGAGREGQFKPWVESECGIARSTAYNYMNAWEKFGDKCPIIGHFCDTAMYLLAAPESPEKATTEAVKLADKGVRITVEKAKELIAKHKPKPVTTPVIVEEMDDEEPSEGSEPSGGAVEPQETEAAPASIPEDSAGQPIPKALREVFDRSKEFDAHARTLTAIQQWAEKIGAELPGKWLHVQSFKADLNNAKQALRHNKPYAVCPYCQAKKPKCEACKGVGFVSKRIYDGAPQELRA